MKIILSLVLLLGFISTTSAQNRFYREEPVLAGPTAPQAEWMKHQARPLESTEQWVDGVSRFKPNATVFFVDLNQNLIGGAFDTLNGVPLGRIASIKAYDTSAASPLGSGIDDGVVYCGLYDRQLFVAGHFTKAGGTTVNNIAAFNWIDSTWTSLDGPSDKGTDSSILTMSWIGENGDSILVGGNFRHAGGIEANHIAIWNLRKSQWEPVIVNGVNGLNGGVACITNTEFYGHTRLLIGGGFTMAGDVPARKIVEYLDGAWLTCGGGIRDTDGVVETIARNREYHDLRYGTYWVGGHFSAIDSGARSVDIALLDIDSVKWSSTNYLDSGTGTVYALASAVQTYFGGDFQSGSSLYQDYLFSDNIPLNAEMGQLDGPVYAMDISGGIFPEGYSEHVLIGGDFSRIGGKAANRIALWQNSYEVKSTQTAGAVSIRATADGLELQIARPQSGTIELIDMTGRSTILYAGVLQTGPLNLGSSIAKGPHLLVLRCPDGITTLKASFN